MLKSLARFAGNDDGAATVDWVVISAAIVGLGMFVIVAVADGTATLGTTTGTRISAIGLTN